MTKYRHEISTSVIIEADNPADAEREFTAARECVAINLNMLPQINKDREIAQDLLLNAKIERLAIEEPWQE